MPHIHRTSVAIFAALATAAISGCATAQTPIPAALKDASVAPTTDAPNPYRTVEGWAKMPAGRTWGSTSAVDIDKDGTSIWVAERCGANRCADTSSFDPIMKFDANGNMVKSFGRGMLYFPHGIHVDRDGNIWVTDGQNNAPPAGRGGAQTGTVAGVPVVREAPQQATKGMQVYKFSPDGQLLLTLGKPGGAREPDYFWQPNDVMTLPNGDILVAEGHSSNATATARILRFDRNGRHIDSWGKYGTGPLEFDQPHALAMDSRGRIYVGDRSNNRIQILDQSGKLLDTWFQFSRASGIWIDRNDNIYVADSESGSVAPNRPEWKRGIRIGNVRDGRVTAFIPDPEAAPRSTSSAEGVAVDRNGVIYGAEVGQRALKRYVRER